MKLIVLLGPTASGKTRLSLELAEKFSAEIINADSRTIYKELDIGTDKPRTFRKVRGKPKKNQKYLVNRVPHHLIDFLRPNQVFSVAEYQKQAREKIKEIQKREKIPFLVGGSPLYIDSVIYNYKIPKVEPDWRLRRKLEKEPLEKLVIKLKEISPEISEETDLKNKRRVIRALEIVLKGESRKKITKKLLPNILILGIRTNREELYQKIDRRVDEMIKKGLVSEVKKLVKKYGEDAPALSGIGYHEVVRFFKKEVSLPRAIELIKRDSRHFAKRQLTWFRQNKNINWVSSLKEAGDLIKEFLSIN